MRLVDEMLEKALAYTTELPVANTRYDGPEDEYIVFNYNTVPEGVGDDLPLAERYLIQVHLFAPYGKDPGPGVAKIKRALKSLDDASFPRTQNASDKDGIHWVVEAELLMEVEDGDY